MNGQSQEGNSCKNRAQYISWPEVIKGIPNQGLVCFVSLGRFLLFVFRVSDVCRVLFPCFWLSVPSAIDCLERLVSETDTVMCRVKHQTLHTHLPMFLAVFKMPFWYIADVCELNCYSLPWSKVLCMCSVPARLFTPGCGSQSAASVQATAVRRSVQWNHTSDVRAALPTLRWSHSQSHQVFLMIHVYKLSFLYGLLFLSFAYLHCLGYGFSDFISPCYI